ncbi:hypothetical protein KCU88_g2953, partial [Aureobasidium melanogenum]
MAELLRQVQVLKVQDNYSTCMSSDITLPWEYKNRTGTPKGDLELTDTSALLNRLERKNKAWFKLSAPVWTPSSSAQGQLTHRAPHFMLVCPEANSATPESVP